MLRFCFFKVVITFCGLLPLVEAVPQSNTARQAEKKMTNGNWTSAHQLLIKAIRKDTLNAEAELLLALWFLNERNPSHQLDSAYRHNLLALHSFQRSSPRQKERLKRNKADSASLLLLRARIDSLAFEKAKLTNTEAGYTNFLNAHPPALEKSGAMELRDEVAFLNALRQNTYDSFDRYLQRYPTSQRAKEAKERFEKLLFESYTKDKKLSSYRAFFTKFPFSPYREVAEKNIFEITTCTGSTEEFIRFIDEYPQSKFSTAARDLLFHLSPETEDKKTSMMISDSLQKIIHINKLLWIPIYKNGKYGFIDSNGLETMVPQFENINEEYKCGNIKDDVLLVKNGMISRSGKILATNISARKDLGFGFLLVTDSSCSHVLHKSGRWTIADCVQEAKVLEGRFLVIKKNNAFGLFALTGRKLLDFQWSSIDYLEGILILDKNGKKTLCTLEQLAQLADGNPLPGNFVFDKVTSVGQGRLLVSNGSVEGILNLHLEFEVPLARQSLLQMPFGLTRKINDKFIFEGLTPELENKPWEKFQFYRQWLIVKNPDAQKLVDTFSKKKIEENPDSLWFANGLAFARIKDSVHVHINSSTRLSLPRTSRITFIKSPDSIRYFFTELKSKKVIFSIETGTQLFTTDADHIESFTSAVFLVSKKNKKGLINRSGKIILPYEYDALLLSDKNRVSLLKEKKFGLFDLSSSKLIKPLFERNISLLNNTMLVAFKGGYYGVIDWNTKPITNFEFDEIQPWKENIIWAKKGFEWKLIDLHLSVPVLSQIKKINLLKDNPDEKLAIIQQENYFGVLSSEKGLIIPPSFSVVVNLGTRDEPIYFTAKEVEEAGIMVVIYYDRNGKFIRKQVYEEEEYNHIVCHED